MKRTLNSFIVLALAVCVLLVGAGCGKSSGSSGNSSSVSSKTLNYPTKTINFVVPAAAGATMDILVRGLDESLDLGRPLAISNMAGASQTLGLAEVASRKADGYTLTCSGAAGTLIQPLLLDLTYSMDDFRYLSLMNDAIPNAIGVSANSEYQTWNDVIAKFQSGQTVHYTSPNSGSVGHMAALNLVNQSNAKSASYVSYNGSAEADTAVLSGDVDFIVNDVDLIMERVKNGQYRCLLVLDKQRSDVAPDVPSAAEYGIEGMENFMGMTWIMVDAETPDEVVTYIKGKLDEAVGSEGYKAFLASMNKKPTRVLSEKELTEMLYEARDAYKNVIETLNTGV